MTSTKLTKLTELELAVNHNFFQIFPQKVGTPAAVAVMWGEMAWCSTAVVHNIKGPWCSTLCKKWCSHHSHSGLQEKSTYFISKGFTILYDRWFYIIFLTIKCPQLKPDQRASGPNQWPPNLTRGAIIQPFWPATTRPVWRTSWDSLVSQDKTLKIWDFPSMQRADTSVLRDS